MKTILIAAAICAVAVSAEARTVKSDTVDYYLINGERVSNFDGSQLVGKTIKSYYVDIVNMKNGNTVRAHTISTERNADDVVVVGSGKMGDIKVSPAGGAPGFILRTDPSVSGIVDVLFVVDGVKMSAEEAQKISPDNIVSMEILNGTASKKYTDKDDVGVVLITTKAKDKSKKIECW